MKRFLLVGSLVASSFLMASDGDLLVNFIKKQVPENVSVKYVDTKPSELKEFNVTSVELSDGMQSQVVSVFTQGDLMFPDVVNLKDGVSMKEKMDAKVTAQKVGVIYQKEKKENIIELTREGNTETKVVFTDPACPHCKAELAKIDEHLAKNNIKFIMLPVFGEPSMKTSVAIYDEVKDAKDTKAKIEVLNKFFNMPVPVEGNVSEEKMNNIQTIVSSYMNTGIRGVPAFFDEKELLAAKEVVVEKKEEKK